MDNPQKKYRDLSIELGPMFPACGPAPKHPMYSYDRPAWLFWQGVADQLQEQGMSEERAIAWLKSSSTRHGLDGAIEIALAELGRRLVLQERPQ